MLPLVLLSKCLVYLGTFNKEKSWNKSNNQIFRYQSFLRKIHKEINRMEDQNTLVQFLTLLRLLQSKVHPLLFFENNREQHEAEPRSCKILFLLMVPEQSYTMEHTNQNYKYTETIQLEETNSASFLHYKPFLFYTLIMMLIYL